MGGAIMGLFTLLFALGATISDTIRENAENHRALEERRRYEDIDWGNIEYVTLDCTETAYRIEEEEEFDPVMTDFLTRQDGWQHYETKTVEYEVEDGENYAECCERELLEETGMKVRATEEYLEIEELFEDWRHINHYFVCEFIEGNFLDFRTTVPKGEETVIKINTRSLISSVDRIALITSDRVQSPVRLSITQSEIKLSCRTAVGRANDEIPVSTIGKDVEIGFNNKYVLEALRNTECDEVKLVLNGSLSPMIIKPVQGEEFIFLVVPMRLNDEI